MEKGSPLAGATCRKRPKRSWTKENSAAFFASLKTRSEWMGQKYRYLPSGSTAAGGGPTLPSGLKIGVGRWRGCGLRGQPVTAMASNRTSRVFMVHPR